jgi:hypothetical protein
MVQVQEAARQTYISEMRAQADALPKEELVACNRFVSKYGSPDLVKKMSDPNFYIGNDVDIIKAFALAGRVADGGFVEGTVAGSDGAGSARMLYDKSNMK